MSSWHTDVHCCSKESIHLAAAQKSAIIQIIGKLIDIIGLKWVCSVPTEQDWCFSVGQGAQLGMPASSK